VTHYERYGWPVIFPYVWALDRVWNAWHLRGMQVEMQVCQHLSTAVHACAYASDLQTDTRQAVGAEYSSFFILTVLIVQVIQSQIMSLQCKNKDGTSSSSAAVAEHCPEATHCSGR